MQISGRELRYVLTLTLFQAGRPMSVADLAAALAVAGFEVNGRASKTISDSLRWEIGRGRVVRLTRSRYVTGKIPTSTRYWIRSHVREMQQRAA